MQRKLNGLLTLSQVATYLDQISDKLEYSEDSESCLIWKDSGKRAGTKSNGYWKVTINKKQFWAHRVVWFLNTGDWPEAYVNHQNLDRGDNRFTNLSLESHLSTSQYRGKHKDNTSGVTGVSWIETRGCLYANAFYMENGKPHNKRFSVIKFGTERAWELAIEFRESKIRQLNSEGAKYNSDLFVEVKDGKETPACN